jgi:hypothetical protein
MNQAYQHAPCRGGLCRRLWYIVFVNGIKKPVSYYAIHHNCHKWLVDQKEFEFLELEILIMVNLILGLLVLVCFGVIESRIIEVWAC